MMTIREVLDHEWFKENVKQNIYINVDVLRNIYDFWRKNVFKRYILNNISKFIVKEDIYKYNSLFFYFDIMEEGSIKYEQYFAIMKKLGLIDANIRESFNGLDISKKGHIQFSSIQFSNRFFFFFSKKEKMHHICHIIYNPDDAPLPLCSFSDVIACLLNSFIKIDKKTALRFFKKVDYDSEGIITKKKLYKFYNMKTKNEISTNDKRKFSKLPHVIALFRLQI
ncbi:protein kinase, putative [Plasmodium ovale curtisi]|uniref:Protein kinase, putative n=1 Tax=Plasmodium ovale curtisi TaxID=864141 RepID=A0A1A8WVB2_PLAOA|nr:protein kinase, putative [Plasmodium ovale curtisi]